MTGSTPIAAIKRIVGTLIDSSSARRSVTGPRYLRSTFSGAHVSLRFPVSISKLIGASSKIVAAVSPRSNAAA